MPLFLKVFLVPYPAIKDLIKSNVAQLLPVPSWFREFFIPYQYPDTLDIIGPFCRS